MTLKNLLPQVATVLEETEVGVDRYNAAVKIFATVGDFPCRLETWRGHEFEVDRDTRVTLYKCFIDPRVYGSVSSTSRLVIDDALFDVWADPHVYFGRVVVNHVECILRRIES